MRLKIRSYTSLVLLLHLVIGVLPLVHGRPTLLNIRTALVQAEIPSSRVADGRKPGQMQQVESMIGSSPPKCHSKCNSCGPCEPVQIPAEPKGRNSSSSSIAFQRPMRNQENTNYKPMNWKCKCGNNLFNP
ncbi:hypothetical protein SUGI_0898370 [Cryptomeria japonica]|uniref:EPIDERMAL PATTERNING FACTOR-like protein 2 n=1 Tax=Cryptomeria japonica TaxID=3369 RepID=UPI0024147216|nr:EPIDERMAL PATTERNING FACTOR-like protein 2 [Cryptomeria japonica]GLJ43269.1 hypothetical protein SUGI_0898370 [Cryptomeria japonica]